MAKTIDWAARGKRREHPLRRRILEELAETESVRSPNELAIQFDEPLGNMSYHIKLLLREGSLELVRTQAKRGALEHFYRFVPEGNGA